jgi:LacI family transcriptional regulator
MSLRLLDLFVTEVDAFTVEAGRAGLARLLDSPDSPSAVFATGEVLALGVLQKRGRVESALRGDLAIIGYTDAHPPRS